MKAVEMTSAKGDCRYIITYQHAMQRHLPQSASEFDNAKLMRQGTTGVAAIQTLHSQTHRAHRVTILVVVSGVVRQVAEDSCVQHARVNVAGGVSRSSTQA